MKASKRQRKHNIMKGKTFREKSELKRGGIENSTHYFSKNFLPKVELHMDTPSSHPPSGGWGELAKIGKNRQNRDELQNLCPDRVGGLPMYGLN